MAEKKEVLFEETLIEKAHFFKALAHPARLQILQFLAEQDSCITGDISDEIPLGRTTVNQHIKELKQAGLIQGEICGVKTKYCLNQIAIHHLKEALGAFVNTISCDDKSKTCC